MPPASAYSLQRNRPSGCFWVAGARSHCRPHCGGGIGRHGCRTSLPRDPFAKSKGWVRRVAILSAIGTYAFPILLFGVPIYAAIRGVKVYETFVRGAEDGFKIAAGTLPYLVAIFAAISCFRGSGALDILSRGLSAVLKPLGIPPTLSRSSSSGPSAVAGPLPLPVISCANTGLIPQRAFWRPYCKARRIRHSTWSLCISVQ